MNVTQETHASWAWTPGSPAAPKHTVGWQPVQLVPENARAGRGGFPLAVPPGLLQAIWIEVYVGRELPPGTYDGTVTLTADGAKRSLPVELRVFGFTLPDANSLSAMVYYEPSQPELYQGRNLDPAYHRFAHRQRIELVHAYDEARVQASRGRFDGTDFTATAGYEGPGEGVGNTIVPVSFYGTGPAFEQKESAWRRSDAWMEFVARTLPKSLTFLYLPDEPYPAQYPEVRRLADNVRSNPGPGRRLPLFLTKAVVPELEGVPDIWCVPPPGAGPEAGRGRARPRAPRVDVQRRPPAGADARDRRAGDRSARDRVGLASSTTSTSTSTGTATSGSTTARSRARGSRTCGRTRSRSTTGASRRKPVEDQGFINGDGVLMYPGQDVLHPEEDRGIEGPVSTVQLANLRRGLQDHLYLTLARQAGLEPLVQETLQAVVPRVYSDAGETVGFAETGEAYDAARLKLGAAIEARLAGGEEVKPAASGLALLLAALVIPRDSEGTGPEVRSPAGDGGSLVARLERCSSG